MNTILFGSTGMVGEGVLHMALRDPAVSSILVVNRRPCGITDPKLTEVIHPDFHDLEPIRASLSGLDAGFFCMGISSIGKSEEEYTRTTHTLTLHVASVLKALNPDMTFCYVSGLGTDSSEEGRSMWARVKGRTENDLFRLFDSAYAFRPGYILPIPGMKHTYTVYKILKPLHPVVRFLFPGSVCTLEELGRAMVRAAARGYTRNILECTDIRELGSLP